MGKKVLLTGGAGFIGSNILDAMLQDDRISFVRVLDNLSTGKRGNIEEFMDQPKFEFMWGDIREYNTCYDACRDMDMVCHQAALGSVPRSIKQPVTTNNVNIGGTLNIFTAAKDRGIKRVVYAASSSTYGDSNELPKREENIGSPISPYAVTKLVNELYASVFGKLYEMEFIGLRYFNIFGPKQDPHGAYAAVIPLFFKAAMEEVAPTINGDGSFSRDFTYVENAVQANLLALFTEEKSALNQIFNIACGQRTSLNDLWQYITSIAGKSIEPVYGPTRAGDVPHSLASIEKVKTTLKYKPEIDVKSGLNLTYKYYQDNG
ncbi:SDR family oxidoreductase [Portibacter marinus]|uniref:SDR family oxidoreductase n=1 Tax=Portibacter marinus TaxID=2898660 RepID=UPI001F1BB583|nr:SDR family oxidoreductase [Portibacter marinus]